MTTLPIHIEVEDVAVGPVLVLLRRTPGVIKFHLDLGEKPVKKKMPKSGETLRDQVLALLMKKDSMLVKDIAENLGIESQRVYGALTHLRQGGMIKNVAKGEWQVNGKMKHKLLPPPPRRSHHGKREGTKYPVNRMAQGLARDLMVQALRSGPKRAGEIVAHFDEHGGHGKSVNGVLNRGKRDKLIKRNADGTYALLGKE